MQTIRKILVYSLAVIGLPMASTAQDGEAAQAGVKEKVLGLELGAALPKIKITTQHGQEVPLAAAEYNRWVFVFFYPKALTGG